MILSFGDKETEKVFNGEFSRKLPTTIQYIGNLKLKLINQASSLSDLIKPSSNHLESLSGKRTGEWSIRINKQWRITFTPIDGGKNYINVRIEDYH